MKKILSAEGNLHKFLQNVFVLGKTFYTLKSQMYFLEMHFLHSGHTSWNFPKETKVGFGGKKKKKKWMDVHLMIY